VGSAAGKAGSAAAVTVSLAASGASVTATRNDIRFNSQALSLNSRNCQVNEAIGKALSVSVVQIDGSTTTLRFLVRPDENPGRITDGPLYTCTFRISPSAPPGTYVLGNIDMVAFGLGGTVYADVVGADGYIAVPSPCTGDCDGDGQVTVDEILVLVNTALGNFGVDACLAGDADHDGQVTVDEILAAVSNALEGCD
jgi:hypothetical protein